MIEAAFLAVVLLALGLAGLSWSSQRAVLARPTLPEPPTPPPVSILKPLKGRDPSLEANLLSFFEMKASDFELVFGVEEATDPALAVVRRLCARFPSVSTQIVVDSRRLGLNPKVNNLANMLRHARHELVLISDSNVRVQPHYLSDMRAHLAAPGVSLVTSPIRAAAAQGLGGAVESLQLNTWVMGGVSALNECFGRACVVGKSMMLSRRDLEAIGGLEHLVHYLAEDQVCGEDIANAGGGIVLSSSPVDNVLGRLSLRQAISRHLRWARIRRHVSPLGYLGEVLSNPVGIAAGAVLAAPSALTGVGFLASLAAMSVMAWSAERRLGARRPAWAYPPLELLRSLMVALLWPVPFFSSRVVWRGHRLRIGARTFLEPLDGASSSAGSAISPESSRP